ncbi:DUF2442 domain-containing protein [Methylococcus capsulatus]|nr:DUF2442 domain-containing protein [Methylococcus capsulatus]
MFERLKEPDFFRRICVTEGFLSWPDEIDLAPDAMYAAIKRDGEWILSGECIFIRLTDVEQTTGKGSSYGFLRIRLNMGCCTPRHGHPGARRAVV